MDSRLLTTPCDVYTVSAGALDEYGDATLTTSVANTTCHLEQMQSNEGESAAVEETRWRVWLPAGTSLDGLDYLVIAGARYALTGDPWPVIRPTTGVVDHLELQARRVV